MYSGLTSIQAQHLLRENGRNEIPEKQVSILQKIFKDIVSPIAIMLIVASVLSFILEKMFDGYFILALLIVNIVITLWQENKADKAIKQLNQHLKQKIKVHRDNVWHFLSSELIVPGDLIELSSGEIIPADGILIAAHHLSVNESALTGESLPQEKKEQDVLFSGAFIASGIAHLQVTATGAETNFGKTIFSVERIRKQSLLEKDIITISQFLTILSLTAVAILTVILLIQKAPFLEVITLDLSLIIAGVPISLPTVMTLIIEFGVLALAAKNVIVRRLSALEDLANVNLLLTDKTGTLTQNTITVQEVLVFEGYTQSDVLLYASIIATGESDNPIDSAILKKVTEVKLSVPAFATVDFLPADSKRKRSMMVIKKDQKEMIITLGAPQIVLEHCLADQAIHTRCLQEVSAYAEKGYRTLAIAIADGPLEQEMKLVGLIALSDTLRSDAKSVIQFLKENGIETVMVTGDNRAIAHDIAQQLHLDNATTITKSELDAVDWDNVTRDFYRHTGAFAEVLPEDKLHLVQKAKQFFIVASNGDGINDLPAVKAANVGIAVKNAVTALKATADIVLLSEGISVIRDAIIESRKIFERLYTYSLYRISESFRLIITIAALGLLYGTYPMTALQIILIALLNDIPIISLALDRVKITNRPAAINAKNRFVLSSLFGLVGVANSFLLVLLLTRIWHLQWSVIQTMFFLKLTVSGHLLIFVAHTKQRWWKFLPSKEVIGATLFTQGVATVLALTGFLMPGKLSLWQVVFVWLWAIAWMQIGEAVKKLQQKTLSS